MLNLRTCTVALATGLLVTACVGEPPTSPTQPALEAAFAPAEKVPVCHLEEETGVFELIMVSANGKAVEKHMAHGDGEPGGEVPGMDGYTFDGACVLVAPQETIFAVAYTDVIDDGKGYDPVHDILIAKIVDADGSNDLTIGDEVITANFPLDPIGATHGMFTINAHTITDIPIQSESHIRVFVSTPNTLLIEFVERDTEYYGERGTDFDGTDWTYIFDQRDASIPNVDRTIIGPNSPSQPDAPSSNTSTFDQTDNTFIDVDVTPLN